MTQAKHYHVVLAGIDTLVVNARGTLHEYVVDLFNSLQASAIEERDERSHSGEVRLETFWEVGGQPLLITPHGGGQGQWKWQLGCPAAWFNLGMGKLNNIACQVKLASPFLWQYGARQAWEQVRDVLDGWGDFLYQPSEVHLCADVAGLSVDALQRRHFVTRSRVTRWHEEDAQILDLPVRKRRKGEERATVELTVRYKEQETLHFSKSSPHSCSIYNKPREIRHHSPDKAWFGDLWRQNGWNGLDAIARVEMRNKREILHEMGIETMEDLFEKLPNSWAYSTQQWIRHTVPTADKNSARWPESQWWQVVQGASFGRDDKDPAQRQKVRLFHQKRILSTIIGYMESWAAWTIPGVDDSLDISTILRDIASRSDDHYDEKGVNFLDEVKRKRKVIGFAS